MSLGLLFAHGACCSLSAADVFSFCSEAGTAFGDPSVALVLLDLKMPGQDGMAVLRKHQDQLEELPVIVVSRSLPSGATSGALIRTSESSIDSLTSATYIPDTSTLTP